MHLLKSSTQSDGTISPTTPRFNSLLLKLYVSHFLSTWNSRMFEFGAVLFIASLRPNTLLYTSVYALVRSLAAAILSSRVGAYVDNSNRLSAVRNSIVWQRIPVALSCIIFGALHWFEQVDHAVFAVCFATTAVLACFEKLAIIGNNIAVERDWVVVISEAAQLDRRSLNAAMRRIDLSCKLLAPVAISLLATYSMLIAIFAVLGTNITSVLIEYFAIARVYRSVPALASKNPSPLELDSIEEEAEALETSWKSFGPWATYLSSPVFLASLSLSLLYLTVLSTGVQYQTYMLAVGYSALTVSLLRLAAVAVELSATCCTPLLMAHIGSIRAGLWSINWQVACLATGVGLFVYFQDIGIAAGAALSGGIIMSRLGLWGIDLAVQDIVQEVRRSFCLFESWLTFMQGTPETARGAFSACELALQNMFELLSFAATIIFPRPSQFQIPILISLTAVVASAGCYAGYVRKERGHLVHLSKCVKRDRYQALPTSH
jgi:iron-regulated transporter 1